jgi:hypothetical protein
MNRDDLESKRHVSGFRYVYNYQGMPIEIAGDEAVTPEQWVENTGRRPEKRDARVGNRSVAGRYLEIHREDVDPVYSACLT